MLGPASVWLAYSGRMELSDCLLCQDSGGLLLLQTPLWRLIRADDAVCPAFYRLIWQPHVAEFSDLPPEQRQRCMELVCRVEQRLRQDLAPTKINLASLGNVVPHLHWHVIARFDWDSHFPNPVWGEARRSADAARLAALRSRLPALDQRLVEALQGC